MKANWLNWPWEIPVRPHQRQRMVHSRAMHPSTITVLVPQLEEAARPDCWCGKAATLVAFRHQIDCCQPKDGVTPHNPNGVPAGAEVFICCATCARLLGQHVADEIEERLSRLDAGFMLACRTCSKPVDSLHDLLQMETL